MTPRSLLEEKLMQTEPHVKPIRFDDYTLFRQFGSGYKNTLTYNAQAVNGWNPKGISRHRLGLKYYDRRNLASIGYFQRYTGTSHFHLIPCEATSEKVIELAELLFQISNSPVYIKKISRQQQDELLCLPHCKAVDKNNGWYAEAPLEDDHFPEQILEVEITLTELQKSRKESQLKDKYVRARRRYGERVQVEPYDADNEEQRRIALEIVDKFFSIQREKNNHLSLPQDYYNLIAIKPQHTIYWSSLLYVEDAPAGFYCAERNRDFAQLYANISLHDHFPYLSEFLMVHLLQEFKQDGIALVNVGGSETSGLHQFKQKFRPVREEQWYWTVYER